MIERFQIHYSVYLMTLQQQSPLLRRERFIVLFGCVFVRGAIGATLPN
jgi:hypothetical protein